MLSKRGIAFQPLQRHTTLFLQHTSPPHNCALFVVRSTHNPRTNHKQQQTKKVGEIIDESNPKLSALNHVANSPCRACPTPPKATTIHTLVAHFFFSIVTPALLFPLPPLTNALAIVHWQVATNLGATPSFFCVNLVLPKGAGHQLDTWLLQPHSEFCFVDKGWLPPTPSLCQHLPTATP